MPKTTFHNLSREKRDRFVDAALRTFASSPYDQASIRQIVDELGIAKGSVYQYFDDKYDLFAFLVHEASEAKQVWFAGLDVPPHADLFARLEHGWRAGLAHWREAPLRNRLLARVLEPSTEPRVAALRTELQTQAHAGLVAMLAAAQQRGEVRDDLDLDTMAWVAQGLMQEGLLRAFLGRLDTDLDRWIADADHLPDASFEAALDVAGTAIEVLRAGVTSP